MHWLLLVLAILVGIVLVMTVVGALLPRAHVAARRATLGKPPADVWRALTELDAQSTWRRGLKRIERLDGARFREHTSQGTITFEVVEERPLERRVTRIADDTLPFGGRWIYELFPVGAGTRLTITEDGFIKNPMFRFLAATVFSTTSTMEHFLDDLGRHLGTPAVVEPAEPAA